ncbi:MAG: serine/threonine-protein kinase [Gemmatimonadaceae bacterium]
MSYQLPFLLLDRYDVSAEIGRGANAIVYRARDQVLGRDVAIKLIRDDIASPHTIARFAREIQLTARLEHTHILHVYDTGSYEGRPFVVMELASGRSLADRLSVENQLSIDEALQITRDVGDALAHAHENAVVHRDVKPENILLTPAGAFIADFGIARITEEHIAERLTSTGTAVGTVMYMSPEQLCADPNIDGRSDLYSLACVLYEMLAGVRPHIAASLEVLRAMRTKGTHAPVRTHRPSVSIAINDTLERALSPIPADRFNTMESFIKALTNVTADTTLPLGNKDPGKRRAISFQSTNIGEKLELSSRSSIRRMVIVGGGIALLAGAAFVYNSAATSVDDGRTRMTVQREKNDADATQVEQLFVDAFRTELESWPEVRLVNAVSSRDSLGETIIVNAVPVGDSIRVKTDLRRGPTNPPVPIVRMVGANNVKQSVGALVREVLAGRDGSSAPGYRKISDRSLKSLRAYVSAHSALRRGKLDSASSLFEVSRVASPSFAYAQLWRAQVGAWMSSLNRAPLDKADWKSAAEASLKGSAMLGADSLYAMALVALSNLSFPEACRAYRALVTDAVAPFVAQYGLGECQRLDRIVIRSGSHYQFRSSHWGAFRAYQEAARTAPSSELLASLFEPIIQMTYASGSDPRYGRTEESGGLRFAALPSLITDTLAFVPIPRAQFASMAAGSVPTTFKQALRLGREVAVDVTGQWVHRDPNSAEGWLHHAIALELAGQVSRDTSEDSAEWALNRAQRLAKTTSLQTRIAVVQTRTALRNGDIRGAVANAERAIAERQKMGGITNDTLAPLAAFLGDVKLTEQFGSAEGYSPRVSIPIAKAIFGFHVRASIGDCTGIAERGAQLIEMVASNSSPAERAFRVDSLLKPAFREAATCPAYDALSQFKSDIPLDSVDKLIAAGKLKQAKAMLIPLRSRRKGAGESSVAWDYLFRESWAFLQVGDTLEARAQLLSALNDLQSISRATLEQIPQAAGVRRGLLLMLQLRERGDTSAAVRIWADRARDLRRTP